MSIGRKLSIIHKETLNHKETPYRHNYYHGFSIFNPPQTHWVNFTRSQIKNYKFIYKIILSLQNRKFFFLNFTNIHVPLWNDFSLNVTESDEEREAMLKALRQSESLFSRYYLNEEFNDIMFNFELLDDIVIGEPFR